jgi:hypothetical protein
VGGGGVGGGGVGGGGVGGGAAPVIDTTDLEDILREAYDRLSRRFQNLDDGVIRGKAAVITVLREIEQALARIPAAEGDEGGEGSEEGREHKAGEDTGVELFGTPTGEGSPHSADTPPRTPVDSARASLIAGTPIEPAYEPERALELAHNQVQGILHHHGGEKNAQTAEIIRKILIRQTNRLRELYTPHARRRD